MLQLVTILAVVVCGARTHADYHPPDYYPCAPASQAEHDFRSFTSGMTSDVIPTEDDIHNEIASAAPELRGLLNNTVGKVAMQPFSLLDDGTTVFVSPYINACCPRPAFPCTSIDIPLWYARYNGLMCYIIYPTRFNIYKRCTCSSCLVPGNCPVVGRCVETGYKYVKVLAYCPNNYCSIGLCRLVKLLIAIPSQCRCVQRCRNWQIP